VLQVFTSRLVSNTIGMLDRLIVDRWGAAEQLHIFYNTKKIPLIYSVSQVKVNNKETAGRRLFTWGITIIWKKQQGKGILAPGFSSYFVLKSRNNS